MLKIDTSGEFAEIEAKGDAQELGKELITIAASLASAIGRGGVLDKLNAVAMLKTVGIMLSDDDFVSAVLDGDELNKGIVSVTQNEDETEEEAKIRAKLTAMQRFTQIHPVKVDENYNRIEESEDEEL